MDAAKYQQEIARLMDEVERQGRVIGKLEKDYHSAEWEMKELRKALKRNRLVIGELKEDYAAAERKRRKWKRRWKLQAKVLRVLASLADEEELDKALDGLQKEG